MLVAQSKEWTKGSSMPKALSEMASALIEDNIYVAGGITFWGSKRNFSVYNIPNDQWTVLPQLPKRLNHIGMTAYNGKIYITGGFRDLFQTKTLATTWSYNPENQEWLKLAPMPEKRAAHSMITIDDKLYVIGGKGPKANEIWTYLPQENRWVVELPNFPEPQRDHLCLLYQKDKLYVVGGRSKEEGALKPCWLYNFNTQKWKIFTQLEIPSGGQAATLYNNKIHIIGGEDLPTNSIQDRQDIYDLETKKWSVTESKPTPKHGMVSQQYNGKWYVVGGATKANIGTVMSLSDLVEIYSFE
ncbi:MAG: hypothetical protein GY810_04895 [Aureispira sp.]|nr:hypothetical protein [Aureispira sp.]